MSVSAYVDTSALAKWYISEPRSEDVESYLRELDGVIISDLTRLEMRSLLRRRRREAHFDAVMEARIYSTFEHHMSENMLFVQPASSATYDEAIRILERVGDIPMRSLDALHVVTAFVSGADRLATADIRMAGAAEQLNLDVDYFGAL